MEDDLMANSEFEIPLFQRVTAVIDFCVFDVDGKCVLYKYTWIHADRVPDLSKLASFLFDLHNRSDIEVKNVEFLYFYEQKDFPEYMIEFEPELVH